MSRDTETAWVGRANTIRRILRREGDDLGEIDRQAITRVQARFGSYCIDTNEPSDPISYDDDDGSVSMQIGLVDGIQVGQHILTLTVFDNDTPEGFAWGDFRLIVEPWDACEE